MYASRMPSESATSERVTSAPRHCLGETWLGLGLGLELGLGLGLGLRLGLGLGLGLARARDRSSQSSPPRLPRAAEQRAATGSCRAWRRRGLGKARPESMSGRPVWGLLGLLVRGSRPCVAYLGP